MFCRALCLAFLSGSVVKNPSANAGDACSILGWDDPLQEEMGTHSSILALKIPWTEVWITTVPGGCKELGMTSNWAWTHDSFQHLCLFAWSSIILVSICCCSVAQSCLTLCNTKECSTPGFPVHHQFSELAQTHLHWVGDAIQLSHSLSSPSSPALNLSQD